MLCKPTARSNFCLLAPAQFSKLIPPFCGVDPVGPGVRWAPQNKALLCKPTRGAAFVGWLLLNCLSYYPHLVGWTLRAQSWSEPPQKLNFRKQTHPKEQLLFAGPTLFSLQTPPFDGVDPAGLGLGWAPQKSNFPCKPTLRSNFCLLDPTLLLTLYGISDGVTVRGTPGGWHFGLPPGYISYFISIMLKSYTFYR